MKPTAHIICETSTRYDGNMSFKNGTVEEVLQNRIRFLEKNGTTIEQYIPMRCDHGETICIVDESDFFDTTTAEQEKYIPAEVLVTQSKKVALFLLTADCQPMSFYDQVTQTIALAHISRKTFTRNLVQKTVGFLHERFAVNPSNLLVYIGPHIKKESYAFTLPLQEESPELRAYTKMQNDYAHIDLEKGSVTHLLNTGVLPEHITVSPIDTGTSSEHFSYYRMKKEGADTTARIATVLMMK